MNRDSYCVVHRKECFRAASTSSSCRRHQNSEEDIDDDFDREGQDVNLEEGTAKLQERKMQLLIITNLWQLKNIKSSKVVKLPRNFNFWFVGKMGILPTST